MITALVLEPVDNDSEWTGVSPELAFELGKEWARFESALSRFVGRAGTELTVLLRPGNVARAMALLADMNLSYRYSHQGHWRQFAITRPAAARGA